MRPVPPPVGTMRVRALQVVAVPAGEIGGGRVETLTTEAVALAAGGDRRLIGVYALLQMLAPFAAFALALGLPAVIWRNRAGMRARP